MKKSKVVRAPEGANCASCDLDAKYWLCHEWLFAEQRQE
jgi:uncharacterized UBP type Zn finger protein